MNVWLNGEKYVLQPGTKVARSTLPEFAPQYRTTGRQARADRSFISSWSFKWDRGFGCQTMDVDDARQQESFWDSELETRYPSQVVLPQEPFDVVHPDAAKLYHPHAYLGQLLQVSPTGQDFKFTPPITFGCIGLATPTLATAIYDLRVFNGSRWLTGAWHYIDLVVNCPHHLGRSNAIGSFVGTQWAGTTAKITDWLVNPLNRVGVNPQGTAFILGHKAGQETTLWVETWLTGIGDQRFSAPGTISAIPLQWRDNAYFAAPEGLYKFIPPISAGIIAYGGLIEPNIRVAGYKGDIYLTSLKQLIHYDGTDLESVGYDRFDGLSSDRFGEVTALAGTWKYLFAAVWKDPHCNILAMEKDGIKFNWHHVCQCPSGYWVDSLTVFSVPDGIERMLIHYHNKDAAQLIYSPLNNPLHVSTVAYATQGRLLFSRFHGGMPDVSGGFYAATVEAEGIGGVHKIDIYYGLDGAAPSTHLGLVSTTNQRLEFGGGLGVEGHCIQLAALLTRGTLPGTTPQLKSISLDYLKIPTPRERYEFTIDLAETARQESRPLEDILSDLGAAQGSRLLLPFWYGRIGTKNVKLLESPTTEETTPEEIYADERKGQVTLRAAEMI